VAHTVQIVPKLIMEIRGPKWNRRGLAGSAEIAYGPVHSPSTQKHQKISRTDWSNSVRPFVAIVKAG